MTQQIIQAAIAHREQFMATCLEDMEYGAELTSQDAQTFKRYREELPDLKKALAIFDASNIKEV